MLLGIQQSERTSSFTAGGTITVNGVTIALKNSKSLNEQVAMAHRLEQLLTDGRSLFLEHQMVTTIVTWRRRHRKFGHGSQMMCMVVLLSLLMLDGSAVTIEAGNVENGYGATATAAGLIGDVQLPLVSTKLRVHNYQVAQ